MTNRLQKFAFSVNSTRPHDTDTVAFSNLSTLESVCKSLSFHIVFVWTGHENASAWTGPKALPYDDFRLAGRAGSIALLRTKSITAALSFSLNFFSYRGMVQRHGFLQLRRATPMRSDFPTALICG